ncbi:PREDICTED: longitudinals lacking protein, isoform G-like [Diuraphis noxia]|uniref:longitudinals lacking protein, isoform G-like n=1 Tax=Diuraphis noxia TaxID=143948 RepID=UPI000763660B|nr:PREDICTED: longitudinals lacking protein, isoform G-like [Diuraphis noxia]
MATITATQRVVNNHLTNFNYHHLSSVIKYLNNQQPTPQQPQQPKTWTTTNALSISQRYFEKIAPASVGIPALMNQNFYDMQDSGSDASGHDGYGRHRRHNRDKEPIFQCPDCDKRYRSKTSLSLHKRLECGKEPAFQCPYCPLKTHQKGNLQVHIKKKHNDHGELNRTY